MGWPTRTIGDLVANGEVSLQTGPFGAQLHAHDYLPAGIAVVPTEGIRGKKIDHAVLPKISAAKALELSRHRLIENDILFARRGVQATGKTAIVTAEESGFICGTGAIRLRVTKDDGQIYPRFLAHLLSSEESIAWLKFHAIGATMPNLNEGIIRSFPFQIPPKSEQRSIAELLSALDDKIELNRRMNETLEASARALFRDWFVDFGPTRAKAEGRPAYLALDLWSLFPDRLGDNGVPKGWSPAPLTDFFDILGGGTPKTSRADFWDGDVPWFSVVDTPAAGSVFVLDTDKTITMAGVAESSAKLIEPGTTIITARGTVGNLAVAARPMAFNQSCYALRGKGAAGQVFVYLVADNMVATLQSRSHGSVFSTITRATFEGITMPKANGRLLTQFEDAASPLFDRIKANVIESRTLAATRDALLPKLMSGELRVRDAEALAA